MPTANAKTAGPRLRAAAVAADVVTINFTEDGITAFGEVWLRGQTLSVERGTEDWKMTCDLEGNSWMDLVDEDDQIERWGQRMFRLGPWKGQGYDLSEDHLSEEDKAVLADIDPSVPLGADKTPTVETKKPRAGTRGARRRSTPPPPVGSSAG